MENKEILIKANNAVAEGDYEGFLAFCTEDTSWIFVGDIILEGRESVRQWIADNYIEPPKFDVKKMIAEDEYVTAIGEIKMTGKQGKIHHYHYCDVWKFREGKMVELSAYVVEI